MVPSPRYEVQLMMPLNGLQPFADCLKEKYKEHRTRRYSRSRARGALWLSFSL